MKLPPSITDMILDHWAHITPERETFAQRIAHEACRLQREADYNIWGEVLLAYTDESPLVVPSTEDGERNG